jgi:hypothetical protein
VHDLCTWAHLEGFQNGLVVFGVTFSRAVTWGNLTSWGRSHHQGGHMGGLTSWGGSHMTRGGMTTLGSVSTVFSLSCMSE